MDQPCMLANPARTGKMNVSLSLARAREFGLASRVRPSRPASACPFSTLRLNLVLTRGIPPDFRGGVSMYVRMVTTLRRVLLCMDQPGEDANPARGHLDGGK